MIKIFWMLPSWLHCLIDKLTGRVLVKRKDTVTHKVWYTWERSEEYYQNLDELKRVLKK